MSDTIDAVAETGPDTTDEGVPARSWWARLAAETTEIVADWGIVELITHR